MEHYAVESTNGTGLMVEVLTDTGTEAHPASIADLTRQELWVTLDERVEVAGPLDPGRSVRLVLTHPTRPTQVADTIVLWHLGRTGNVVVLKRPGFWDPPSRRDHMRLRLAVPVYLKADDGSGPMPTTSVNIGVGGLFCTAAMDLRIAQRLDVAIHLTPDVTFECEAEVARLDEDPNDPVGLQLMVGLHFLDLPPQDQAYLAEMIAELARNVDTDFVPTCWQPGADPLLLHIGVATDDDFASLQQPDGVAEGEADGVADGVAGPEADGEAEAEADALVTLDLEEEVA